MHWPALALLAPIVAFPARDAFAAISASSSAALHVEPASASVKLDRNPPISLPEGSGGQAGLGRQGSAGGRTSTVALGFLPQHDPLVAMGLSVALTGGGQFYNGQAQKGWLLLGSWLLYPVAWVGDWTLQGAYLRTGVLLLELGLKGYSAWDAYATAVDPRHSTTKDQQN